MSREQEKILRPKKENLENESSRQTEEAVKTDKEDDEKIKKEIAEFYEKGWLSKDTVYYDKPIVERYRVLRKAGILKGPEELLEGKEKSKNFGYIFGNADPENLKYFIEHYKIGNFEELENNIDTHGVKEALKYANPGNLKIFLKLCENQKQFKDASRYEESRLILESATRKNLQYLAENKIINSQNFFRFNSKAINLWIKLLRSGSQIKKRMIS